MVDVLWATEIAGWKIELQRRRKGSLAVRYGAQVEDHLSYDQAVTAIGKAVMHAVTCEGKLD